MLQTFSGLVLAVVIWLPCTAQESAVILPKSIVSSRESASAALAKARADYQRTVEKEMATFLEVVRKEMDEATKRADLDLALALRDIQRSTTTSTFAKSLGNTSSTPAAPAGVISNQEIPLLGELPDEAFTASASWKDHPPHQVRFSSGACWASEQSIAGDWLHIDLGEVREVVAIGMLGRAWGDDQRVTAYTLETSNDGENWQTYQSTPGTDSVLPGAVLNRDTEIRVRFAAPLSAKYLRISPTEWNSFMSMRCEVYVKPKAAAHVRRD